MAASAEIIKSRSNPLMQRLRALKEAAGHGALCLLDGPRLLLDVLDSGGCIVEAVAAPGAGERAAGAKALRALEAARVPVRRVDERLLASLSEVETSQGILAIARRPRFEPESLFAGTPLIVVAAGLQNPGNLGSLLRTSEAAGASGAYLTEGTADPLSAKALRGSMGSAFRLPHVRGAALREVLDVLARRGVALAAAVGSGGTRYDEAALAGPLALFVGHEAAGLPPEIQARADLRLSIPMHGRVESLNVGVAAGILLFEAARQRRHG